MRMFPKNVKIMFALILAGLMAQACGSVMQYLTDIQRLQFKLAGLENVRLAGVNLVGKHSLSDLSIMDGLSLAKAYATKEFPLECTLNVAAKNPNDGKKGAKTSAGTITGFAWRLLIDDKETISGNIAAPVDVPASGQETIIPLAIKMDVVKFFSDKGYEGVANLALALSGAGGTSHVKLDCQPSVKFNPYGTINYPGRLTIVDKEYR